MGSCARGATGGGAGGGGAFGFDGVGQAFFDQRSQLAVVHFQRLAGDDLEGVQRIAVACVCTRASRMEKPARSK
jgi:hypothetical protein